MVDHHEEAPVLARAAEVPDGPRPSIGGAVDEDVEIDDGDAAAVRAACCGVRRGHGRVVLIVLAVCERIGGVMQRSFRHCCGVRRGPEMIQEQSSAELSSQARRGRSRHVAQPAGVFAVAPRRSLKENDNPTRCGVGGRT